MPRKLILVLAAAAALAGAAAAATPAQAGQDLPGVRAGRDQCGNFQIWINGSPTIHYLICNPPA